MACFVVEGRVGHAQSRASAVRVEEYFRICEWNGNGMEWHERY